MQVKQCTPTCKFFRCQRRALKIIIKNNRRVAVCMDTMSLCDGPKCKYAMCLKRRLLPDGRCGMAIKSTQKFVDLAEEAEELDLRLKSKALDRLGERDFT